MENELDSQLAATAPPLVVRTDDVQRELRHLVAAAEAAAAPRRRRFSRRVGLAGLAAASAVALGVTASATGTVDTPWSSIVSKKFSYPGPSIHADELSAGTDCKVVYGADQVWEPDHHVGVKERSRLLAYAREFVLNFDISTISVPEAVARYEIEYDRLARMSVPQDFPTSRIKPEESPDETRMTAVLSELDRRLQADLKAKGMSPHAVSAVAMPECEVVTRPRTGLPEGRP